MRSGQRSEGWSDSDCAWEPHEPRLAAFFQAMVEGKSKFRAPGAANEGGAPGTAAHQPQPPGAPTGKDQPKRRQARITDTPGCARRQTTSPSRSGGLAAHRVGLHAQSACSRPKQPGASRTPPAHSLPAVAPLALGLARAASAPTLAAQGSRTPRLCQPCPTNWRPERAI